MTFCNICYAVTVDELREKSLSHFVVENKNQSTELFLFAEDENREITKDPWCGAFKGDIIYRGDYKLFSVRDDRIISELNFYWDHYFVNNDEMLHNGIHQFIEPKTKHKLIAIYQYQSCNSKSVEFFRVNDQGRINQISFLSEKGPKSFRQTTSPTGFTVSKEDELVFCVYSNVTWHTYCNSYDYNVENFLWIASWQEAPGEEG